MVSCIGLAFGAEKLKVERSGGTPSQFDGVVRKTEKKLLEAAIENFHSIEQWELLTHRCYLIVDSFHGQ